MTSDLNPNPELEIAHVLMMDVVGYSRLPMEEQSRLIEELQELVRRTSEFRRATTSGELICLPRGDGMGLVFFRNPVAPVRCALEIAQALQDTPQIELRMGVHSGPVYRVQNINADEDVSGGGINMAQRVMDCGDAGHILLSQNVADILSQLGSWEIQPHDLGKCEVKHGVRIQLFNLHTDELGNSELPQKLRMEASTTAAVLRCPRYR